MSSCPGSCSVLQFMIPEVDIVLHHNYNRDYANTIDAVYTVRVAANGVLGHQAYS